jgi:alcohol dehydrogenase
VTEPAATALHAINLSMKVLVRPVQECRVLIIGGGAIGMLSALLLGHYGCDDLTVAEVNPLRRAQLEQHARVKTCNPKDSSPPEDSFDYVIDAVGSKITRNTALAAVRAGGVVMHIGLQDWASEIDMRRLTLAEITLLGTYTYTTADLRATVAAIHRGAFGDLSWVDVRPLADGAQAFKDLDQGKAASAKVILTP